MLKAIIVDDEALPMKYLKKLLSETGQIEMCHTFMNPLDACDFVKSNLVDLAFLDIAMPEIDGMRLSGLLMDIDDTIDVVFVTAYDHYAVQAFEMGAVDYVLKPVSAQRLAKTLDKIKKRPRTGSQRLAAIALTAGQEQRLLYEELLTEQETKVLRLIADGLSNKEIVPLLNITAETVKFHVKNLYRKLGVNNRVRALQRAIELRILA
ncbi:response regulator transcription factor [Paenibacillus sp. R14(2021)]|uniref:response regulator transcription factor n=1 Tax=Paenibacillus sp. R14(2021) TaxID=2859228 RepID=UPI001C615A7A|nr:response regulator transcription factor [Paenibacillus sp. R14(2021)]